MATCTRHSYRRCPVSTTVVYEDSAARAWAQEAYERIFVGPGCERVQSTWWKLDDLGEPAVLAGAVSKATRAKVIVVAIRERVGFPLPFYVWIGSWMSHRRAREGKLVALIATPRRPVFERSRAAEYLRVVAQQAGMHFEVTESSFALEARGASERESGNEQPANAPALTGPLTPRHRYSLRSWRMEG